MKKRFNDEQKVRIVAESRAHGVPVTAKKHAVSKHSVYLWRRTLTPKAPFRNHVWCYDFVHDRDASDRTIRCLTVKDEATALALAIEPAYRFGAK